MTCGFRGSGVGSPSRKHRRNLRPCRTSSKDVGQLYLHLEAPRPNLAKTTEQGPNTNKQRTPNTLILKPCGPLPKVRLLEEERSLRLRAEAERVSSLQKRLKATRTNGILSCWLGSNVDLMTKPFEGPLCGSSGFQICLGFRVLGFTHRLHSSSFWDYLIGFYI